VGEKDAGDRQHAEIMTTYCREQALIARSGAPWGLSILPRRALERAVLALYTPDSTVESGASRGSRRSPRHTARGVSQEFGKRRCRRSRIPCKNSGKPHQHACCDNHKLPLQLHVCPFWVRSVLTLYGLRFFEADLALRHGACGAPTRGVQKGAALRRHQFACLCDGSGWMNRRQRQGFVGAKAQRWE
jgi:hypothetical protein